MANIKSQIKRNRQNEKRRLRNRFFRGAARTAVKDARLSLESKQETPAAVMAAISALDKAARKGSIHARNAARRKSRLVKQLAALGMQPKAAVMEPAAAPVEKSPADAKPAKAEKAAKPVKETKPKAEAKKSGEKKPAAKKPAAKN